MRVLTCPSCQGPVDLVRGDANDENGGGQPKDPALCSRCGLILVLNETLAAELASTRDLAELRVAEPELHQALLAVSAEIKTEVALKAVTQSWQRKHRRRPGPQQDLP